MLAKKAGAKGEVPVGAVIVKNGEIIAKGYNRRETAKNVLGHAEIEAINNACEALGTWRLNDCELYVTLEPCPMCAGAIINARIKKVVFGAFDRKMGACDSVTNMFAMPFGVDIELFAGIKERECAKVLTDFFDNVRKG